jgi:hypothetical protein
MSARYAVVFVNPNCAYVSGYGSRELLTDLRGGRPPVWSSIGRAWVTTSTTAGDFIAIAERRGAVVEVSEGDPLPAARGLLW